MSKFSGSKSDALFGQLRHIKVRGRSQNYWDKKNKVRERQRVPAVYNKDSTNNPGRDVVEEQRRINGQDIYRQRLHFQGTLDE